MHAQNRIKKQTTNKIIIMDKEMIATKSPKGRGGAEKKARIKAKRASTAKKGVAKEEAGEGPGLFGLARRVAKRVSRKGRAKAKDARAARQEKRAERKNRRADRKEARAKRVESRNPARAAKLRAKAKVKRAKADVKTEKAGQNKKRATDLRAKKSIKSRVSDAFNKKKKEVGNKIQKKKKQVVDKVQKTKRQIVAGVNAAKATPMYDGPGGQETPKLGSMSDGMSQYGKEPGMGMYGKGSKISYGMGNTVGKPGNAKIGTGVNKNSSAMVQRGNILKHMSRNRK